jgi:transposase
VDCCCEHVPQIPSETVPPRASDRGKEEFVKRIRDRVAALDVHRDTVMAATWVLDRASGEIVEDQKEFSTMTGGVVELGRWLLDHGVTTVGMEATGDYWKPVYYGLEGMFNELAVYNAQHVKNVPGRKTDLSDAMWLADVIAHGMVRASFVPAEPIRELRDLSRYRKTQIDTRGREIQRLDKVLQDACVKLTSVASTVWSKSSRRMIEALIAGERDPQVLAEMAMGRMRPKIAELTQALVCNWRPHHSLLASGIIAHIDHLDAAIDALSAEIGERCHPFEELIERMSEVPGVSRAIAEVVIAETGGDTAAFPTPQQLCAWAGVAPGNRESAGKRRPTGSRKGQRWLRRALVEAAKSLARNHNSFLGARYRRVARRRGGNKAAVAVAHSILIILWHLMADPNQRYIDLGADYYKQRQNPERQAQHLVAKLAALGYTATLQPAA